VRARRASAAAALLLGAAGLAIGLVTADLGAAGSAGRFAYSGVVIHVVDGDTLDVRLSSGRRERVRLIGIDTPERGDCYFGQASGRARSLALRNAVVLRGDATQDTRDRYGRLLAYVDIAGRGDLGAMLIREGYGEVYVYSRPFTRLPAYRAGQASAKGAVRGLWRACASPQAPVTPAAPTTPSTCHPNYSKCLPIVGDLDCADVRALGKAPVQVTGADPYRLDGDDDGLGCE
jgi:endonuclease YncB( thermonuclease family)